MKRFGVLSLLLLIPFLFDFSRYYVYFVDQPSAITGSADVEPAVTIFHDTSSDTASTPVSCLAGDPAWSLQSASYSMRVDSTTSITGSPIPNEAVSDQMDSLHPLSGMGWACFLLEVGSYSTDAYGTVTYQVAPPPGTGGYTIWYSGGSVADINNGSSQEIFSMEIEVGDTPELYDSWELIQPAPVDGQYLNNTAFGNGVYVAVGSRNVDPGNVIYRSTNSTSWSVYSNVDSDDLQDVTFGNGQFVAVSSDGKALTSTNGMSWTVNDTGTSERLYGITWGNNQYVAVGDNGSVVWSSDGASWSSTIVGAGAYNLRGVIYGEGLYVAGGRGSSTPVILTSSNGQDWAATTRSSGYSIEDVAYGASRFVATDSGFAHYSSDGTAWSTTALPDNDETLGITYGEGVFMIVGNFDEAFVSPDGVTWTNHKNHKGLGSINGVEYAGGRFVAVGDYNLVIRPTESSSAGGGGGGCNTIGPVSGGPLWPDIVWITLLAGILLLRRWRLNRN